MRNFSKIVLTTLAGTALATAANAGSSTGTFTVNATVNGTCTVSGNTLNFGAYDGTADVLVDTSVNAICTNGTPYTIALDGGANGGTPTVRKLKTGTGANIHYLNYTLQQPSGGTNWGTAAGQTVAATGDGTPAGQSYTVHGKIALGQATFSGSYTDTITATITF